MDSQPMFSALFFKKWIPIASKGKSWSPEAYKKVG